MSVSSRLIKLFVSLSLITSQVLAQGPRFQPGDRVECDWLQNGHYEFGTVVPFASTDLDQSGRWFRVKLDSDKIPNSTVECMADRMRSQSPVVKNPKTTEAAPRNGFQPGDRVQADKAQIGIWELGTVVDYLPGDTNRQAYYRVRLDGYKLYPEGHQIMVDRIRRAPSQAAAPPFSPPPQAQTTPQKAAVAPRSLPGTAWKIDFGRGMTGTVFLFCTNGRWEIVPDRIGSIGAVGSSYKVSGNTLTTVNRDDGMVQNWRTHWQGDVLELNDGKQILKLHYNGTTQCH